MALNSIRPGQGFLKSQQWKIGRRTQVVALMWASSWIDELMIILWCRAYRREVLLAHGVGQLQGYLCAGVLTWICEGCRAGTGTPGDGFTVIVVAACNRKPLFVLVSEQAPKPCAVSGHNTAVYYFSCCCAVFYVALPISVPSIGK